MPYFSEHILKNGKKLELRTPVVEDAEAMVDFIRKVDVQTMFLGRDISEFRLTNEIQAEKIRDMEKEERYFHVIGVTGGKMAVECFVKGVNNTRVRLRHRGVLGIVVDEEFWGLGIGKICIGESIKWCAENGYERLELSVSTDNYKAISLYLKMGFVLDGRIVDSMKFTDGTYADGYTMSLDVRNF